jgi:hypothetical protein
MRFLIFLIWLPTFLLAEEVEVDVELFLAVDVSRSMTPAELEIQRRGYAEALSSAEVISAIRDGLIGRIALTYVEWAGEYSQRVVVPWTLIETGEDARDVASRITAHFEAGLRRTSISGALLYAAEDFEGNGFRGMRRVIDVSGDGPNNQGRPVLRARQSVLDKGIIINGLPLMTQDALSEIWGIPDLDVYYQHCVIGGPGAFVVPVYSWDQFAQAVQRKLVLEIAGLPPRIYRAQMRTLPDYDCLIGEKLRERNLGLFELP